MSGNKNLTKQQFLRAPKMTLEESIKFISTTVKEAMAQDGIEISVDSTTTLIGGESALDSMKLVELCLTLEDHATELGFEFDWTSEAAMSRSRSMFRSVQSLAEEFTQQHSAQA